MNKKYHTPYSGIKEIDKVMKMIYKDKDIANMPFVTVTDFMVKLEHNRMLLQMRDRFDWGKDEIEVGYFLRLLKEFITNNKK